MKTPTRKSSAKATAKSSARAAGKGKGKGMPRGRVAAKGKLAGKGPTKVVRTKPLVGKTPPPRVSTTAPSAPAGRGGSHSVASRAPKTGPGPVLSSGATQVIARSDASAAATRWAMVTARDLMRENVVTVSKDTPLSELERILSDQKITGAPVTDEGGVIVGVVSVRDLIDRYSEDSDSKPRRGHGWFALSSEELNDEDFESFEVPEEAEETVADIMTATVVSVPEDAGIREIAKTMTESKVHRVLVERAGRPGVHIGIVGTFEILDMLAE